MTAQTKPSLPTRLSALADEFHAKLNDPTVKKFDDVEALQKHEVRRRVVWTSPGGTTRPPKQAGGRLPADGSDARIVACRTREANVEAHIFADTLANTELLLDNLIAAICLTMRVVEIPGYSWETQERENSGRVLRSQYCILRVTIPLPVPEQITPLLAFEEIDDVCGTIQPDGSIVPQYQVPP